MLGSAERARILPRAARLKVHSVSARRYGYMTCAGVPAILEEAFRMSTLEEFGPEVRAFVSSYGWHRIDPVPWATLDQPLCRSRVGLVVTACM